MAAFSFCCSATAFSNVSTLRCSLTDLVEQHRVHRFVAGGVRLALVVTTDQIGIHFFHCRLFKLFDNSIWVYDSFPTRTFANAV